MDDWRCCVGMVVVGRGSVEVEEAREGINGDEKIRKDVI